MEVFAESPYVLVTESGKSDSKMLGYVSKANWESMGNKEVKVFDFMKKNPVSVPWDYDLAKVEETMTSNRYESSLILTG